MKQKPKTLNRLHSMTAKEFREYLNGRFGTTPSKEKKPSKFRNKKTEVEGIKFDSLKEANRFRFLRQQQIEGRIKGLKLQHKFEFVVNGERVCSYIADFTYTSNEVGFIVEDVKSEFTRRQPVYRIKKKLMKAVFGIEILET